MAETIKMTRPLISAEAISKSYFKGQHMIPVLQGAGLKANRGEFEAAGFQWRGNEPSLKSKDIKVPEYLLEK